MVLLWITPQQKKPAHSWIERALCKFFNSRPIDRAQILWIARFVNGYDRNIYTASSRSLFHSTPSERLFGVHPVDRCYFRCKPLPDELPLACNAEGTLFGGRGMDDLPYGPTLLTPEGLTVVPLENPDGYHPNDVTVKSPATSIPVAAPIWDCIRDLTHAMPLSSGDTPPQDCFKSLLFLCERHYDVILDAYPELMRGITAAAASIVKNYQELCTLTEMDILAGVCPRQLFLVILWITPQENQLAHNWIARAFRNFFDMHNLQRVQILLVAQFVNGYVLHDDFGTFRVHPAADSFFCCQRLPDEPALNSKVDGIPYGSTGRDHGRIGPLSVSGGGLPVVDGLEPYGRTLMEDSIVLSRPRPS